MADSSLLIQLLSQSAAGDRSAFSELYQETSARLFGLALRILRRRDWAEETLQDGFLKIWRRAADFDPQKGNPLSWMATIIRNRALDLLRHAQWERPLKSEIEPAKLDEAGTPLDQAIAGQEGVALQKCLEELEPASREAIQLAFWNGLSHQELAARLSKPLGTVKSWVRRGLERLRDCLKK
jgi:RNA polymerase sigma-70 factor (ECF subfamily)